MKNCLTVTIQRTRTRLSCPSVCYRRLRWGGQDLWSSPSANAPETVRLEELVFLAEQIDQLCQLFPEIEAIRLSGDSEPIRSIEQLMRKHCRNYSFLTKTWL